MPDLSRRQFLATASAAAAPAARPNVVLIYCDDLGYGDLGCYGSRIRTPNLDRMAREGARFTHFLSANPVCSPSRAALLTGRYPTRVNVPRVLFPPDTEGLARNEKTLADLLKARGYRTQCVGKWHLGHTPDYLPTSRGFDNYFGIPYSNDMTPPRLMRNTETVVERADMDTLTESYTKEAVQFIDKSKNDPFFLYLPHTMVHIPLGAGPRFKGKSKHGLYGDAVEEIDWSTGEILAALKRNGLDRNTLVLFSSDNGPWYQGSPGRLRGRKGSTYEGGVRLPLLARMPGRIPAGLVSDSMASTMDVVPTVARLAGAELPSQPLDGVDILPLLTGQKKDLDRDALLYFDGWNIQCIRRGPWKLHVSRYNTFVYGPAPAGGRVNLPLRPPELYNLAEDPDESNDVAAQNPEIVSSLTRRIGELLPGFPEAVRKAWDETAARRTRPAEPGRLPAIGAP